MKNVWYTLLGAALATAFFKREKISSAACNAWNAGKDMFNSCNCNCSCKKENDPATETPTAE